MSNDTGSFFGLDPEARAKLSSLIPGEAPLDKPDNLSGIASGPTLDDSLVSFREMPAYKQVQVMHAMTRKMGIHSPFNSCHESISKQYTRIYGEEFLNYSTYDYLGLNGHPRVNAAAVSALEAFGTSAGASRLVSGERPMHRKLEAGLAENYDAEGALVFVSGHATNVSTLAALLNSSDAVYHDALSHDSILQGALLSGAHRYSYPHNDCEALERLLRQTRTKHRRALIVTEGLFSMDGSIARLPQLVALKKEYKAFLMLDEAHALGVLGATGRGSFEHFGIAPGEVDIWMGTLSKTLCSCGGFIAGDGALIELLRFRAPGFVYSVGMSPPLAAASAAALELMREEPERVQRLAALSAFFLEEARKRGLNTGYAEGYGVIPIIVGSSLVAGLLSARLFERRVNVMPIIFPVVEEGAARLRFFLSAVHEENQVGRVLDILCEELDMARDAAESIHEGPGV